MKDDNLLVIPSCNCKFLSLVKACNVVSRCMYMRVCAHVKHFLDMFQAPFEMPYVVKLHNMNVLDTAKPLFHFHHPNKVKGQR